ncbi:MAG: hypothetical protein ABSG53_34145 [Thermoguttaceae bacterium]
MKIECLLNPGVFRFQGKIWLLLRVAERPEQKPGKTSLPVLDEHETVKILEFDNSDPQLDLFDPRVISYAGRDYLTTLSHLRLVASEDGVHFHEPAPNRPILGEGDLESYGIEDCRVVQIGHNYYLTFTQVSQHGVGVGLRSTSDWSSFRQHGMILPPHNKDCAIFGEKIGGRYYALHRPSSPVLGGNYIWIAESPDLEHWGNHHCLAHSRKGMWDSVRVGAGGAPGLAGNLPRGLGPSHAILPRWAAVGPRRAVESARPLAGTDHGAVGRVRTGRISRQRGLYERTPRRRRPGDDLLWRIRQRDLRGKILDC